jgi:hypothetical protein
MDLRIYIDTTNTDIVCFASQDLSKFGVSVEEAMLKADSKRLRSLVLSISIAAQVANNMLPIAEWIYDKLKDKPREQTVINGYQINAQTVTVQTIQIYLSRPENGNAKNGN